MGSKIKAHDRIKIWQYKIVNGKKIRPILYNGKSAGLGKFMAGVFIDSNEVVCDSNGRAIPYKQIVESDD
jgi:hypothetical protein